MDRGDSQANMRSVIAGSVLAFVARALFARALLAKLRRNVARLNAGDYGALLSVYADDAVLVFHEGEHRWSGEHRGKPAIGRFLQNFAAAGLQGELSDLHIAGPPWAMTIMVRFDDRATDADGSELYSNRVVVLLRTRWGKIVRHDDFYEDTNRIGLLERRLTERGVRPVT